MKKRIFAMALALCMMLSAMPTSFAGNGFLTLGNGEQEPSEPSGILTPGDPVLPEEDLSGEPHLTLDDPAEGSQPAPDDPIDEPHLTLDNPVDEPEDRPAHQWRPAPFEEETFTQCDICGYLDGSHAGDCPVVNPPEEQAPAQSTIAEYKPAPMSAATYQDIYDSMMSAETLAEYKAELSALSADLQEEFFSLLTGEEREALSEREDSLAHDALTVTGAENATRTVTVEARASAFTFALHEALRQLGQDLIVSIYGRILESVDLPQNDYTMLETITPTDGARYQWQIQADDDLWVDIYNETGSIIRVSYAMVASLLDRYDAVQVRCEITGEDGVSYTDPVEVCVDYTSEDVYIDAEEEPIEPVILDEGKVEITQGQPVEPEAPAGPEEITEPEDTAGPATPAEPEDTAAPDNTAEPENTADPVARSFSVTRLGGVYAQNFSVRQLEGGTENITYNVVINYVFADGAQAAAPYTASLAEGSNFSATVTFPTIQGYLPYVDEVQKNSIELNYIDIQKDYTINVVYKPTNVNYTVIHYQQNLNDDNYTEKERETKQGLTNSAVPDVAKTYEGFYALLYEKPAIAADGSTVVEVYYDRYYYLMNFDLDGGYGVEPIYARYGTPIDVGEPTKAGYEFKGWDETISKTMPAENTTYKAQWTNTDSSFTVVYWLENADNENYSVFGSYTVSAQTGDSVNGETYKTYRNYIAPDSNFQAVENFIEYEKADTNVTVAGDKSTVVNVYYTRKAYTLKFYYAMEDTTNKKYYVIGGSTYAFGATGTSTTTSIDNLTNYYMDGGDWVSHRGQVDEIPTLNSIGSGRDYSSGYDTASKTVGGGRNQTKYSYQYYYISFNAKYGADISALWPCNVFNSVTRLGKDNTNEWSGTEAFVSAWNGEHHVYYSQHNENQTIKGNYSQLDSALLWDYAQFNAYADSDNTVDFLCFWENGANIKWSVPKLFRYQVWVSVVDGQNTAGLTTKTWNNKTYYLRNTYDTVDDSDTAHQTAPAIQGLTYMDYDFTLLSNYDTVLYKEAYEVNFYYTRKQYNLIFQNDGNTEKSETIDFDADISGKSFTPTYPSTLQEDGYEFDGWYTSSTCAENTKFSFENAKMPANDVILYAKWVSKYHTVSFYLDKDALDAGTKLSTHPDITVSHGSLADPTPADPENGSYTFVGWFYMDGDTEKAFDFANIPIKKDMQVYGKWSSNVLKQYTVYYKIQGTDTEIAAPTTGSGLAGATKTFEAKGGTDLYAAYQEGYFPVTTSHSMTLDIEDESKNTFTFWYVQKEAVPYTVKYLNKETGEPVATEKTVSDNRKAVVTETFVPVSGMMPDAYQKRLVVSVDENGNPDTEHNVIIFYYTKDTTHAYYKITHYTENVESGWTEYASSQIIGTVGMTEYSASSLTIPGFTYSKTEYVVPNTDPVTTAPALTTDGLEINLYYTRNSYPYQVRYLEQGTGKQLADPKNGTGKYGEVVSENPVDLLTQGYAPVDKNAQTLPIRIEESQTEAKLNIITFYYKLALTDLTITKQWDSEDDSCYKQDTIFIVKGKGLPEAGLRVVIPHNESSVTITGLTVGQTYTVTEDSGWSWRYTATSVPTNGQITLVADKAQNKIAFTNTLNPKKIYWLDDSDHKKNQFGVSNGN